MSQYLPSPSVASSGSDQRAGAKDSSQDNSKTRTTTTTTAVRPSGAEPHAARLARITIAGIPKRDHTCRGLER